MRRQREDASRYGIPKGFSPLAAGGIPPYRLSAAYVAYAARAAPARMASMFLGMSFA